MARLDSTAFNLPSPLDADPAAVDVLDAPNPFLRGGQLFTEELDQLAREAGLNESDEEEPVDLAPPEPPPVSRSIIPGTITDSGEFPTTTSKTRPVVTPVVAKAESKSAEPKKAATRRPVGVLAAIVAVAAVLGVGLLLVLGAGATVAYVYLQKPVVPVIEADAARPEPAPSFDVAALEAPAPVEAPPAVETAPTVEVVQVESVAVEVTPAVEQPPAAAAVAVPRTSKKAAAPAAVEPTPVVTEVVAPVEPAPAPAPVTEAVVASAPEAAAAGPQVVKILTVPPTATVKVDGVARGRTPSKLELAPGTHAITVSSGSSEGTFTIDVVGGQDNRWCYAFASGAATPGPCPR